jgi:hypothetical protein
VIVDRPERWGEWASRKIQAIARQASCALSGEAVVLHLDSGLYFGLDEIGAHVWQCLTQGDGPRTGLQLRDAVLEAFDVDSPTCEQDLAELLDALRQVGLIEIPSEGAG